MDRLYRTLVKFLLIMGICTALFACGRVTQANFEKIKSGMNMQEVVAILGEPTNSGSIDVAGVSGTSATWKDSHGEINIQFLNDQVTVKTFSKEGGQGAQQNNN